MFRFTYIGFLSEVSGVGTSWTIDKHAKEWAVEEKGAWIILTNTTNGQRRRVPMTSVAVIHEIAETKTKTETNGKKEQI